MAALDKGERGAKKRGEAPKPAYLHCNTNCTFIVSAHVITEPDDADGLCQEAAPSGEIYSKVSRSNRNTLFVKENGIPDDCQETARHQHHVSSFQVVREESGRHVDDGCNQEDGD